MDMNKKPSAVTHPLGAWGGRKPLGRPVLPKSCSAEAGGFEGGVWGFSSIPLSSEGVVDEVVTVELGNTSSVQWPGSNRRSM